MMKSIRLKSLVGVLLAVCVMTTATLSEVEAARAGSGRSSGVSRWRPTSQPSRPVGGQRPDSAPSGTPEPSRQAGPAPIAPVAAPSSGRSWLGPLAGLAAGFGLAHLFGSSTPAMADNGASSGGGSGWFWLLLLVGVGGWWLWRRRSTSMAGAGSDYQDRGGWTSSTSTTTAFSNQKHTVSFSKEQPAVVEAAPSSAPTASVLSDKEAFLQAARQYFMSLQSAFDKGDLEPFRDWMVPELLVDLSAQIRERGNAFNQTEVLTLSAQILDEKAESDANWVSVRFFGTTKEHPEPEPQSFNEAWHFKQCRFTSNDPWKLAGIEPIEA